MSFQLGTYNFLAIVCPGVLVAYFCLPPGDFDKMPFMIQVTLSLYIGEVISGICNILENLIGWPHSSTNTKLRESDISLEYEAVSVILRNRGRAERLEIYTEKYGMLRGMCIASLICAIFSGNYLGFILFTILTAYRARHFVGLYSKEIIEQYKALNPNRAAFKK